MVKNSLQCGRSGLGRPPFEKGTHSRVLLSLSLSFFLSLSLFFFFPSSVLAWRIPWTEEAGGLKSIGLQSWSRLND